MFQLVIFFILGGFAVLAGIGVIYFRNPVYSALSLVATLFAVAGLFLLLEAYFVAAVQVIVYTGAIMVLFLFVIMLLDLKYEQALREHLGWAKRIALVFAGLLFAELIYLTVQTVHLALAAKPKGGQGIGEPYALGELLFTKYLLPFEIASLVLLAALIGVITLIRRRTKA